MSDITQMLGAIEQGDPKAAEELLSLVYEELRRLAAFKMANEAAGQTLQPTALVHEAWLRLVQSKDQTWKGREHFFAAAAEAMRRILIDKARSKNRQRHGQGLSRVNIDQIDVAVDSDDETLLRVDAALEKLAREDPVKAELLKLRFFVGLTIAEAGQAMGLSESTSKRYWAYSRAWLYNELKRD